MPLSHAVVGVPLCAFPPALPATAGHLQGFAAPTAAPRLIPMPHTTLWLIRHGETDWNRARRFQGHTDTPLNRIGLQQAEQLALSLALHHQRERFAALYASDLARATQTAAAVARQTGLALATDAALREQHYGVLARLTPEEMAIQQPEAYARWIARDADYVLPGGESRNGFSVRVLAALKAIANRHPASQVLVVAHGGVLDCAYRAATGQGMAPTRLHDLLNASINRVRFVGDSLDVVAWGDISHLQVETQDEV